MGQSLLDLLTPQVGHMRNAQTNDIDFQASKMDTYLLARVLR